MKNFRRPILHTNAKKSLAHIEARIGLPLRDFLLERYDRQQLSFQEISDWLLAEKGFVISESTLRKWYIRLIGKPRSISDAMMIFYENTASF